MFNQINRMMAVCGVMAVAVVALPVVAGPVWDCGDPEEPGSTPSTAEIVSGTGPLATIRCALVGTSGSLGDGLVGDFEDMYLIEITDPEQFMAMTVVPMAGGGFNTQLWLFDIDGRGVLANSLNSDNPPFSFIGPQANDGSGAELIDPGLYYIAISGGQFSTAGRFPVDGNGNPIFNFDPAQPELIYGPATSNPIAGWQGEGEIGNYEIEFLGAGFVPPSVPTMTEWGLIMLGLLLLTAGTLVIRHRQHEAVRLASVAT